MVDSLRNTLRLHTLAYERVREREAVLGPYASASELFEALSSKSSEARLETETRAPLLRVIVLEYQRTRSPVWYALAVCGLEPMLKGIRAGVRDSAEEADQVVQLAVVQALARLRLNRPDGPVFPFLTLRRAIIRALVAARRAHREPGDPLEYSDELSGASPTAPHEDAPPFVHYFAREVGEIVVHRPGGEDYLRVLAGAETLDDQVERLSPEGVSYECLQKRHRRMVLDVRRELSRAESQAIRTRDSRKGGVR
jgi:hypothetical protein